MSEERLKEIKDILEFLKVGIDKLCISKPDFSISYNDVKILLDYITNLQQENKELKKKITFNEKSRRKMQQSLMEQIEDYKSRIEKAVEYIENHPLYTETYDYNTDDNLELNYVSDEKASDDLLNILRGNDNG